MLMMRYCAQNRNVFINDKKKVLIWGYLDDIRSWGDVSNPVRQKVGHDVFHPGRCAGRLHPEGQGLVYLRLQVTLTEEKSIYNFFFS